MKLASLFVQSLTALPGGFQYTNPKKLSNLGTLPTVPLPEFLDDGPMINGYPWGIEYSANSTSSPSQFRTRDTFSVDADSSGNSACGGTPNTGVYRYFDWTVTRDFIAPDGFNKSVILINDQFPGPTIMANWGDTIQVRVTNKIDTEMREGISLHWHGFTQAKTPWFDGVPGVSQCPIAPGSTFTYTFQADQYGTSWYHSHYSSQYSDGLFGPIVIAGPKTAQYDIDLGPVILNDYFHQSYYSILQEAYQKPPAFSTIDNNLLNGKGIYNCGPTSGTNNCQSETASFAKFNFTTGKTHRIRIINAGVGCTQKFSIDGHKLKVVAQDFVPIRPYETEVATIGIGQRLDVLVTATGKPKDAVWMRSDLDIVCSNLTANIATAFAAVYYPAANQTSKPNTTAYTWSSMNCQNDPLQQTVPFCAQQVSKQSTTQQINIDLQLNKTGNLVFMMDNSSFITDYNDPVLFDAKKGQNSYPRERNVYNFGSNSSVRIILKNIAPFAHPMHLHGHNFWILAEGVGKWDGSIVNPQNPVRRDTFLLRPGMPDSPSYIVLQWDQNNPGIWPLHCHISLHVSVGLYINVMELPDQIRSLREIPMVMKQTCVDWDKWTKTNSPDQIDSGV